MNTYEVVIEANGIIVKVRVEASSVDDANAQALDMIGRPIRDLS